MVKRLWPKVVGTKEFRVSYRMRGLPYPPVQWSTSQHGGPFISWLEMLKLKILLMSVSDPRTANYRYKCTKSISGLSICMLNLFLRVLSVRSNIRSACIQLRCIMAKEGTEILQIGQSTINLEHLEQEYTRDSELFWWGQNCESRLPIYAKYRKQPGVTCIYHYEIVLRTSYFVQGRMTTFSWTHSVTGCEFWPSQVHQAGDRLSDLVGTAEIVHILSNTAAQATPWRLRLTLHPEIRG